MDRNSENIGFLIVDVRTANGAFPVPNASVYVTENSNLQENGTTTLRPNAVLYSLRTDESGKTPKVALETKTKELSMESGNPRPFLTYNIAVYADGFYNTENINVPIFEGITSIQTVNLVPLAEYSDPSSFSPDNIRRYVETPDTDL